MKFLEDIIEYFKSKRLFITLREIFLLFAGLFLATNFISIYVLNARPDTSFTAFTFTLVSLVIACHAVVIAIDSDEKMKSISTGNFYEITYRFWDRAEDLYTEEEKLERDTISWQLGNLFRHAEKLKKWVEPDVQEKLIKEFKTFLERLRPTTCKKYWAEVKNYKTICKIAIGFKTKNDGIKDELIDELGNWIGKKEERESNQEYLQRKNNEFSHKEKYDIFTG